jgi:Ca2+-binding RTX toxin-like protein
MLKLLGPVVAAVLSLVLAGSAWGAATISVRDGEVLVAGSGESEDLLLRATDERVFVRGRGGEFAATTAGAGCEKFTEDVSCFVGAAGMRVRIALGGGADRLEVLGTGEGELSAIVADLGAGDDRFDGSLLDETVAPGPGSDVVDVGEGDDTVTYEVHAGTAGLRYAGGASATAAIGADADTLSGAERIVGTPRADSFTGGPGAETLLGGAGDDAITVTGPGRTAPDAVDCGSGRDSVTAQAGYDTVAGCEVVNGVDTTPVTPLPEPPIPVSPLLPPLPPLVVLPPPGGLT